MMTPEQHDPPPKHPDPGIKGPQQTEKPVVTGRVDGNAFGVLGAVKRALQQAGQGDKVKEYMAKATSGDYNNLLRVSMEYADFELGRRTSDEDA